MALRVDGFLLATYSRTQPVITLSSCEAEIIAGAMAASEGVFVTHLLHELSLAARLELRTDSEAFVRSVSHPGVGRMRHLSLRVLWLFEQCRNGRLQIVYQRGVENVADIFTKALAAERFQFLRAKLGVVVQGMVQEMAQSSSQKKRQQARQCVEKKDVDDDDDDDVTDLTLLCCS